MKKIFILILLIFLWIFRANVFAEDNASTSALQFLNLGIGARAIAMGEANIVSNNDASMIYWNPSILARLQKPKMLFMHGKLFADMAYNWVSFVYPTFFGGLGIGVQYVDYGEIDGYAKDRTSLGTFNPNDKLLMLSYGQVCDFFDIGVSFKYIESVITEKATGYAVDFGFRYEVFEYTRIGFVAKNYASSEIKYKTQNEEFPKSLELGLAYEGISSVIVEVNAKQIQNEDIHYFAGLEYFPMGEIDKEGKLFLRGGYNSVVKDVGGLGLSGISLGFGIKERNYTLDYSYKSMGELGINHIVSFSIDF